jgi:deoxyribonuclease IV
LPNVRIGAHVKAGKGLVSALEHGAAIGAEVVQIHTQSPRMWRGSRHSPEQLWAYRDAQFHHPPVAATFCHATYLINLATPDAELTRKSRASLAANLATAQAIGSDGLVLHLGSHRGSGFEAARPKVAEALIEALDVVDASRAVEDSEPSCPILLENTAGAGDTIGRSFDELAQVIEAAGADERLGVCLDTQHLWASGVSFVTMEESEALVRVVDSTVGLSRLRCLHLNDSKVDFGANRDRHQNIGEGTIGADGLATLLGHPSLQGLPAILEVPGDGSGPRAEDIETARKVWEAGLALWRPNPTP